MRHKIFTIVLVLFAYLANMQAQNPVVYNFAGITADMITTDGTKGTYSMDGKDCPSVSQPDGKDINVRISGMNNLVINYTQSAGKAKDNVLKFGENYMQADTKNVILTLSNMVPGSKIQLIVSGKGSTNSLFRAYEGCVGEDQTVEKIDSVKNYKTIEFIATASTVQIKEMHGGFRIVRLIIDVDQLFSITTTTNDASMGRVQGAGKYADNAEVELLAIPNNGYHFVRWNDGITTNPRTVIITQDTIFKAMFAQDTPGTCGKNYALTWAYNASTKTLTISGNGSFDEHMECGIEAKQKMENLIISEGVTAIGDEAFSNCAYLVTVQLPTTLKTIGERAFYNNLDLTAIYNYRENPCLIKSSTFENVNTFDCILYVLDGSVTKYRSENSGWKIFYEIKPIGGTTVDDPITDVETQPNDNNVVVTWPVSTDADTYTLQITKDGIVFCTLIFDANGQLKGIAFAPSKNGSNHHSPAAVKTSNGGLRFTVTGLDSNTNYHLKIETKDSGNQVIATYTSDFTTTGVATAIESPQPSAVSCQKIIRNGQIFILRGEKVYTLTGQEVR